MRQLYRFAGIAILVAGSAPALSQQVPPAAEPLGRVDFPPYETRTLENGLQVIALEHNEQPVISIRLVITAGEANDPPGLSGLAAFTSELLLSGTTTRTAEDIAEAIDFSGGELSASAAREAITVSASFLADSRDLAFDLLQDIVLKPAFAEEEIERLRQLTASSLAANLQDPDFIADTVFNLALYGNHPYAHPGEGTPSSVERIERDDVLRFHETFFAPNITTIIVAGALEPSEAFRLVEETFGEWTAREVTPPDVEITSTLEGRRILVVDNPSSVQTEIRIGRTMVARKDADYFPVLVATYVLGGPDARLINALRQDRGLTYGAYQTLTPRKGPGSLYALTETRTEETVEAINLIFSETERLRTETVPEDELDRMKALLIGSFPMTIETPDGQASRLANIAVYDLGPNYLATYRDDLAAITSADVARVARRWFSSEDVLIVLVGRAAEFLEDLETLGQTEVIPLTELDLDSALTAQTPPR